MKPILTFLTILSDIQRGKRSFIFTRLQKFGKPHFSNTKLIFSVLLIFGSSCLTTKYRGTVVAPNEVVVFQDGKESVIRSDSQVMEITEDRFSIRFYNKKHYPEKEEFYAAQIAALTDEKAFRQIQIGQQMDDIPYFVRGSGMAADQEGYEVFFVYNEGHHYLYYENETNKRLELIGQKGDNWRFEFTVDSLWLNDEKLPLQNEKIDELYLVILIDRNLNRVIDKGELSKLTLKLSSD